MGSVLFGAPSNPPVLNYSFDNRTCRKVADALGLPVGTVKRRLHGSRVTFKDISVFPKGVPQIIATFCIEKDGTLSIDAVEEFQEKPVTVEAKTGIETVSVQTL